MKKKSCIPFFGLIIILSGWWFLNMESATLPDGGVLDVWVTWGDSPEPIQTLFDRFGQHNDIPVRVTTQVREDDLLEAMTSSHPPDLVILSSNQLVQTHAEKDLIEPLNSWIEKSGINLEDIYPVSLAQCVNPESIVLCLPWGADVFALYWNKDLFAAAGLDPAHPPQTMEELAQYAKTLSQVDGDGELIRMGFMAEISLMNTMLLTNRAAVEEAHIRAIPYFTVFMDLLDNPNAQYMPASSFGPKLTMAMHKVEKITLYQENSTPEALLEEVQAEVVTP